MLNITFIEPDGHSKTVNIESGESFLRAAHSGGVDLEGACGGSLNCGTCHVIVDEDWFSRLPSAKEDEEQVLDVIFDVTERSRLACQLKMKPELSGCTMRVAAINSSLLKSQGSW